MTQELLDAITHARINQLNQKHALNELHTKVVSTYFDELGQPDVSEITQETRAMLTQELSYSTTSLQSFKAAGAAWPLKTNKISDFIIPECEGFFQTMDGERLITQRDLKNSGYDLTIGSTLPLLRNDDAWKSGEYSSTFWGTSKPTYLAAELTFAYFTLQDKLHPETPSSISDFSMQSPLHHVVPCDISSLPQGSKLIYNVSGKLTGYGFIHGGYAFGGSRFQEPLYPEGKKFAPHDCSSFVKEYLVKHDAPNWEKIVFSTLDLTYGTHKESLLQCIGGEKACEWYASLDGSVLNFAFNKVDVSNIMPGDIWVIRKNCSSTAPYGTSGHTGIISNVRGENFGHDQIEILSTSRDMPHMEGLGIQHVEKIQTSPNDIVFYLRSNDAHILHEGYSMRDAIMGADQHMLDKHHEYVSIFGSVAIEEEA